MKTLKDAYPEKEKLKSLPAEDGFRMPGEFEPHAGCVMIWPVRPGSWPHKAKEAQETFAQVAHLIARSEPVFMLASPAQVPEVREKLCGNKDLERIHVLGIETDDAWARDVGPTFVLNSAGEVRGIDWQFNAWGGKVDGLYAHWEKDNAAAGKICEMLGIRCYDAQHFVMEGGAVHSDGEGTLLVTQACLLSAGRNSQMTKLEIERTLKQYLKAEKVIWLPRGIWQDETNEHVDNICAFVRPGEVVLAWTDDPNDPQFKLSNAAFQVLSQETDAKGRRFVVHKLPIPEKPVHVSSEDLAGFSFEKGEAVREEGERLAASYVNFYISNQLILVPKFDDQNDAVAVNILRSLFPKRKVVPVEARPIILGGGNIHCITQQIPYGKMDEAQMREADLQNMPG